jgi:hypothetical protein
VTIKGVHISAGKQVETGFTFDINPTIKDMLVNQHIRVSNVTMDATTTFKKNLWHPTGPKVNDDKTVILIR